MFCTIRFIRHRNTPPKKHKKYPAICYKIGHNTGKFVRQFPVPDAPITHSRLLRAPGTMDVHSGVMCPTPCLPRWSVARPVAPVSRTSRRFLALSAELRRRSSPQPRRDDKSGGPQGAFKFHCQSNSLRPSNSRRNELLSGLIPKGCGGRRPGGQDDEYGSIQAKGQGMPSPCRCRPQRQR